VIGTKGFWYEDNDYCEITGVIDEGVGLYEFTTLEPENFTPDTPLTWIGFIDDFSEEC